MRYIKKITTFKYNQTIEALNKDPIAFILFVFCYILIKEGSSTYINYKNIVCKDADIAINVKDYIQDIANFVMDKKDYNKNFRMIYNECVKNHHTKYIARMKRRFNKLLLDKVFKPIIDRNKAIRKYYLTEIFDYITDNIDEDKSTISDILAHVTFSSLLDISVRINYNYCSFHIDCFDQVPIIKNNRLLPRYQYKLDTLSSLYGILNISNDDCTDFILNKNKLFDSDESIEWLLNDDMIIYEFKHNNKPYLAIPIILNGKSYIKLIDNKHPLTILDLMMINHQDSLYQFMDVDSKISSQYDRYINDYADFIGWNTENSNCIKQGHNFGDDA